MKRVYTNREFFNSLNQLTLYGDFRDPERVSAADEVWNRIMALLEAARRLLSTNVEGADIFRFNQAKCGEAVGVNALTAAIVQRSKELSEACEGTFDPSVYPLVDLWGFTPRAFNHEPPVDMPYDRPGSSQSTYLPPDERYVQAFKRLVGMGSVEVKGDDEHGWQLVKRTAPVTVDGQTYQAKIDLGGVAKGFFADYAAQVMHDHGFDQGTFSTASSMAILKNGGINPPREDPNVFRLGITNPRVEDVAAEPANFMQVLVHDCGLSTSGDYGRCAMMGDIRVSHEIDGRTGYPVNVTPAMVGHRGDVTNGVSALRDQLPQSGICSLTLMGPSAMDCDALTTALYLMGEGGAVDFYNRELAGTFELVMATFGSGPGRYRVITSLSPGRYRMLDKRYEVVSMRSEDGGIQLL